MQKAIAYRKLIAMLLCVLITAFTLSQYAQLMNHLLSITYNGLFEMAMVAGMIVFQYPWIRKYNQAMQWEYVYRMLMVSLLGAVLLWPLLIINHYQIKNDGVNLLYFFIVVTVMFFVHKKIVVHLQLPAYLSYTWILYRIIILILILPL